MLVQTSKYVGMQLSTVTLVKLTRCVSIALDGAFSSEIELKRPLSCPPLGDEPAAPSSVVAVSGEVFEKLISSKA